MTAQHTPGPWIGAGPSFGDPLPRYTTSIMTEWEHEDDGFIDICAFPFHHHDGENEANARLIAAAPELLEALQAIIDTGLSTSKITAAKKAIAKATGEQS